MPDIDQRNRKSVDRRTALRHGLVAGGTLAWSVPAIQALATSVASAQSTSIVAAPAPPAPPTEVGGSQSATQEVPDPTSTTDGSPDDSDAPSGSQTSGTRTHGSAGESSANSDDDDETGGAGPRGPRNSNRSAQNPSAQNPSAQNSSAQNPSAQNPSTQNPSTQTAGGPQSGGTPTSGGTSGPSDVPVEPGKACALVVLFTWRGQVYGAKLLRGQGVRPLHRGDNWMAPGTAAWEPWQGGGQGGRDKDRKGIWVELPQGAQLVSATALVHDGERYHRNSAVVAGNRVRGRDRV